MNSPPVDLTEYRIKLAEVLKDPIAAEEAIPHPELRARAIPLLEKLEDEIARLQAKPNVPR